MFESLQKIPTVARLASHIPPLQFDRYLIVGVGNTVFGYSSYAVLTAVITPQIPHAYVLARVPSSVLNITVSFLKLVRYPTTIAKQLCVLDTLRLTDSILRTLGKSDFVTLSTASEYSFPGDNNAIQPYTPRPLMWEPTVAIAAATK